MVTTHFSFNSTCKSVFLIVFWLFVQACCSSDEDSGISEQDILHFKANHKTVAVQRQELRVKLRQKFEKMSLKTASSAVTKPVNGLTPGMTVVHQSMLLQLLVVSHHACIKLNLVIVVVYIAGFLENWEIQFCFFFLLQPGSDR